MYDVVRLTLIRWDWASFDWINLSYPSPFLDTLGLVLSASATWWVSSLLIAFIAYFSKRYNILKGLAVCGIAIALSDSFATYVGKPTLQRPRPCYHKQVRLVADGCGSWYGLPSNHATNGAAITAASSLFLGTPWLQIIAFVTFLVGLSRIYLGVHFPGDVLLGFVFGTAIGLLVKALLKRTSFFKLKR